MKPETIEAWCVVYGSSRSIWNTESDARQQAMLVSGTVVRLTGELPKVPRKRVLEAWVSDNCLNGDPDCVRIRTSLPVGGGYPKVKITIEEILE